MHLFMTRNERTWPDTKSLTPCTALEEELQTEELKKEFGKRSKRKKVI